MLELRKNRGTLKNINNVDMKNAKETYAWKHQITRVLLAGH